MDVRKYGSVARDNVKKVVKEKIRLLGSANKAKQILDVAAMYKVRPNISKNSQGDFIDCFILRFWIIC